MAYTLHQIAANLHASLYTKAERELRHGRRDTFAFYFQLCNFIAAYCDELHQKATGTPLPTTLDPTSNPPSVDTDNKTTKQT